MKISLTHLLTYSLIVLYAAPSAAYEYDVGFAKFKLTGYGSTAAMITDGGAGLSGGGGYFDNENIYNTSDFKIRGQVSRDDYGVIYSLDRLALDDKQFARDLFGYYDIGYGRFEFGQTDAVSVKMALGLPDVGGLRANDSALFIIGAPSDGYVTGTRYSPRVSFASKMQEKWQWGASAAAFGKGFDSAFDVGIKYKDPYSKFKTSYSVGLSYIDSPHGMITENGLPSVYADSRSTVALATNMQYNSFVFGAFARTVYDVNPQTIFRTDGINGGAGISYDLLAFSVSLSYMYSNTNVWGTANSGAIGMGENHAAFSSLRYKFSGYIDAWITGGFSDVENWTPFGALGLRVTF